VKQGLLGVFTCCS